MLNDLLRSLPYRVHTNRELGLMLAGTKPLASFCEHDGCWPEVLLRYFRLFDRQVSAGRLARHDHHFADHGQALHRVQFALPGETWRFQAMIELWSEPGPWTQARERREGELLGYADWMNDYWLHNLWGKP